jgi:transposase
MYQERPIFYTQVLNESGIKVTIFTDKSLALEEEKTYLKLVDVGKEGYTMEGYQSKQIRFGRLSLMTNCKEMSPYQLYQAYKTRMEVEGVFDTYKNLLEADRSYMQNDKSFEAWAFINHLATMLYYRLFNLLKHHDLLQSLSVSDLLLRLSKINKNKINGAWLLAEVNTKTAKLLQKLNLNVT